MLNSWEIERKVTQQEETTELQLNIDCFHRVKYFLTKTPLATATVENRKDDMSI